MFVAPIDRPAPGEQRELEPWLHRMVDFFRAETVPTALPHVPGVTLRLAPESVPLWTRIESEFGPTAGPPYWAFAWASGLALARHVMDHPDWWPAVACSMSRPAPVSPPSRRRRAAPRT